MLTGELQKSIQHKLDAEKVQNKSLQDEIEKLKEELSVEKRESQVFQQKCHYLENTVIPSSLERLKAVEYNYIANYCGEIMGHLMR